MRIENHQVELELRWSESAMDAPPEHERDGANARLEEEREGEEVGMGSVTVLQFEGRFLCGGGRHREGWSVVGQGVRVGVLVGRRELDIGRGREEETHCSTQDELGLSYQEHSGN